MPRAVVGVLTLAVAASGAVAFLVAMLVADMVEDALRALAYAGLL